MCGVLQAARKKESGNLLMKIIQHSKRNGMSTSQNKYDALEALIFDEHLQIETIIFHEEVDLMLVVLNTKAVLRQKISSFKFFDNATSEQLQSYELIAAGTGVHWPLLDADLSLKGFLREELKAIVTKNSLAA